MQAHVGCAVGFMLLSDPTDEQQGDVITLEQFTSILRELKPGWNPMSFLYKSGQLVAAGAEAAYDQGLSGVGTLKHLIKKKRGSKDERGSGVEERQEGVEMTERRVGETGRGGDSGGSGGSGEEKSEKSEKSSDETATTAVTGATGATAATGATSTAATTTTTTTTTTTNGSRFRNDGDIHDDDNIIHCKYFRSHNSDYKEGKERRWQ